MDSAFTCVRKNDLDLFIWLHSAKDPSDAEWDHGLAQMAEVKKRLGGDLSRTRSLAISDGGAPGTSQRSRMHEIHDRKPTKISLVTISLSNPIKRGIVTAISWMNPSFRAFLPAQTRQALAHLDLPDSFDGLLPDLLAMQARMIPVITLQQMIKAARKPV